MGANWFNTRDTIKRMRYARDKGADAVQICFPGWMEMREVDYDQFLIDCCEAVPDIAIIHYNIARTKKLYFADDYLRVMPKVPTMIGTKAAMPFNNFIELMSRAPQINHFVGESYLPPGAPAWLRRHVHVLDHDEPDLLQGILPDVC